MNGQQFQAPNAYQKQLSPVYGYSEAHKSSYDVSSSTSLPEYRAQYGQRLPVIYSAGTRQMFPSVSNSTASTHDNPSSEAWQEAAPVDVPITQSKASFYNYQIYPPPAFNQATVSRSQPAVYSRQASYVEAARAAMVKAITYHSRYRTGVRARLQQIKSQSIPKLTMALTKYKSAIGKLIDDMIMDSEQFDQQIAVYYKK